MSQLAELRKIIVGEQADQLDLIKERLDEVALRSQDVAEVLPEAISKANDQREEDLAEVVTPIVTASIKRNIQKHPEDFAKMFYPALVPSIRLMIANMLRSFTSSMDQTIESATSLKGLKWRFESMRTGVPYSELALRRALEYRVEQIFVIQSQTGLLIEHVLNEDVHGIDSDAVSGMLTAIQSFVTDSFDAKSDENLTNMQVGELNVWMVHGPEALIACVIRGDAPNALRGQLIDVLDQVHIKYAVELSDFDGESKITGLYNKVEPCLQLKLKEYEGERSKTSWLPIFLLIAIIVGLLYWLWHGFNESNLRNRSSKILAQTPGVLATDLFWDDGKLNIVGLIDPVAEMPWEKLNSLGLQENQIVIEMKQFRSLEPAILSKRLQRQYDFPESLNIDVREDGGIATANLAGELSYKDYRFVRKIADNSAALDVNFDMTQMRFQDGTISDYINSTIGIPSGVSVNDENAVVKIDGVPSINWLQSLQKELVGIETSRDLVRIVADDVITSLGNDIRSEKVIFDKGEVLGTNSQNEILTIASKIKDLSIVLAMQKQAPQIVIIGSTDGDNTLDFNKKLRIIRAEFLYKKLIEIGVNSSFLEIQENNNLYGDNIRGVNFRVLKAKILSK